MALLDPDAIALERLQVTPSSRIQAKVAHILRRLQVSAAGDDNDRDHGPRRLPVVAVCATLPAVNKLVSIVEIAKREAARSLSSSAVSGQPWLYQYTSLEQLPPSAAPPARNAHAPAETDDYFHTLTLQSAAAAGRPTALLLTTIYLCRESVPVLKQVCGGEQPVTADALD